MVYVPARHMRPERYSVGGKHLQRYEEYTINPRVWLPQDLRTRTEASSRRLAERLLEAVRGEGLEVHPYQPIRDRVLRGKQSWVPAVLRYSLAQNAVLVESCNMNNIEDRANLASQVWRERFARSLVAGLARAFGSDGG
jgi:N-acetylmuramoyl-L-alanine amidase